jgi:hypothetical protein
MGRRIPMLEVTAYILNMQKNYRPTQFDIGDQTVDVLSNFADNYYQSTYNIYSSSKRMGLKSDYKNTHKRVKRLEKLGFIQLVKAEEVKVEDARRGAKYYRITEIGMFQLFLQHTLDFTLFDTLQTNGNYSIFETFLNPYFEKKTFQTLNRTKITTKNVFESTIEKWIIVDIYQYLRNCCIEINQIIKDINDNKGLKYVESVEGREYIERMSPRLLVLRDYLALNLLGLFDGYKKKEWLNSLTILANDNKFMKLVDDLHKDFGKCYGVAMRMGKRS